MAWLNVKQKRGGMKISKGVIVLAMFCVMVLNVLVIRASAENTKLTTELSDLKASRVELRYKYAVQRFNAGYRAGALDATSELIECEGVTDPRVKTYNDRVAEVLRNFGELDESPYPCEE
jgi:hypothetical protein